MPVSSHLDLTRFVIKGFNSLLAKRIFFTVSCEVLNFEQARYITYMWAHFISLGSQSG